MAGPVDEADLLRRSLALVPSEERGFVNSTRSLVLAVACGPRQSILRPSEMENRNFHEEVSQAALFGPQRVFTPERSKEVDTSTIILCAMSTKRTAGLNRLSQSCSPAIVRKAQVARHLYFHGGREPLSKSPMESLRDSSQHPFCRAVDKPVVRRREEVLGHHSLPDFLFLVFCRDPRLFTELLKRGDLTAEGFDLLVRSEGSLQIASRRNWSTPVLLHHRSTGIDALHR